MRVDLVDLLQQVDLVLGQTHVGAVKAFRLEGLRQADVHQYALGVLGEGDGLGFQLGVGLVLTLKALGIADVLEEVAGKQRHGAFHALGVDHAAARALIAGLFGKIANDGHLCILAQGQNVALVLQQHDGLFSRFQRVLMLLLHVHRSAVTLRQRQHHVQQFGHALVDFLLGDAAFLDSL